VAIENLQIFGGQIMTVLRTELDALLERVREDKADTTGKNRNAVAYDCWRMFEDLAVQFKEESAMRDRYKRQSNSWRDKAFELADETQIAKLKLEAQCPCCRGAEVLQPCQECHGSKLASVAYDTVRVHYKRNEEVKDVLLEAVKDALASEKQFRMSKVPTEPEVEKR
jgi:hypothetical protein